MCMEHFGTFQICFQKREWIQRGNQGSYVFGTSTFIPNLNLLGYSTGVQPIHPVLAPSVG